VKGGENSKDLGRGTGTTCAARTSEKEGRSAGAGVSQNSAGGLWCVRFQSADHPGGKILCKGKGGESRPATTADACIGKREGKKGLTEGDIFTRTRRVSDAEASVARG